MESVKVFAGIEDMFLKSRGDIPTMPMDGYAGRILSVDLSGGEVKLTKTFQDLGAVVDSSGICTFTLKVMWVPEYVAVLNAVCGFGFDETELLRTGERIWNLQRLFNVRAGFGKKDDTLPSRLRCGPPGARVWRGEEMLEEYYALRGRDAAGVPSAKTLRELGIACEGASAPHDTGDTAHAIRAREFYLY